MKGTTYNQLIIFQTIAREKSISKASRALEMAPASVSQALKTLETKLEVALFTRTTRRVELTEAGLLLFEKTSPLLDELALSLESVSDLSQTPSGRVSITMPRFVYQNFIKPIYVEFCQRYPAIQLELSVSDATIDILKEGIDLGIRFEERLDEGFRSRVLTPAYQEALFAAPSYIEKYGMPKKISELCEHKLIHYRFNSSKQIAPLLLMEKGKQVQAKMQTALIVNDTDLMVEAAKNGLGIGRMLTPGVEQAFANNELLPILASHWQTVSPLHLYFHKNADSARRVRVLIDFLYEKLLT